MVILPYYISIVFKMIVFLVISWKNLARFDDHWKSGVTFEYFTTKFSSYGEIVAVDRDNNLVETLALIEAIAKHFTQPKDLMAEYKALLFAVENKR